MESKHTVQLQMSNNTVPAIATAEELAQIRMDEGCYPHYRNIPPDSRIKWMAVQIQFLAGIVRIRDFDAREPILMATVLDEMMAGDKDMLDLTLPEIAGAFKSGVFGLYGEFCGLTAPNLYGFMNSFLESSKKREATDMVIKSKVEAYRERTAEERAARQRRIQLEIAEAKRTGAFVPTGQAWFKPKTVNEAIDSSEHRDMVRRQAREILNRESHGTDDRRG